MLRKSVGFLGWFFERRDKMDWTSWRSLIITFPAIVGVFFVAPQAIRENSAARRQQTSQGLVTSYEPSQHNQCRYTFPVQGKRYSGMASAPTTDVAIGDRVLVYFDSQDPTMNALEDFTSMSQRDKGFVSILIVVIAAFVGFILISKATQTSVERRSTGA